MDQDILERCVSYFTHGGPIEWIGGGITIGTLLLTTFTKLSVPGIIRSVARQIMEFSSRKNKIRLK